MREELLGQIYGISAALKGAHHSVARNVGDFSMMGVGQIAHQFVVS